jgi:uncharacterized protein (DUF433 family)
MNELTALDVLKLLTDRAQQCRENGDSDMRNILNTARHIKTMLNDGKSREEILADFAEDEDEE